MTKKGEKPTHYLDGRPIFTAKNHTGGKYGDWVEVKYKKIRADSGYTVMLRLSNGEDIIVQKSRSVLLKKKKKVFIEPNYYETTHKEAVEKVEE